MIRASRFHFPRILALILKQIATLECSSERTGPAAGLAPTIKDQARRTNTMIMADILKIFLLIVGVLTVFVSYWLIAQALFPGLVERARRHYSQPVRITLIGLAAAALPVVVGAAISSLPNPALKLIGVTLLLTPALLGLVGSAGLTVRIGAGLPSPTDEQQPWRQGLRGGILLALSFLLPFVGWIVLPIWTLVGGLGALILSLKEARNPPIPASPVVRMTPATSTV